MITLTRIAKLAHVSVSTVSKAFAMSSEVNDETREAIFDIAKQYGCFKKYYRAKYPKHVVAIICPEFGSRYYADSLSVIQKKLSEYGCEICVAATNFSEEAQKELLDYYNKYTSVDAVMLVAAKDNVDENFDLPVAAVFSPDVTNASVIVTCEYEDAICEVISHFVQSGIKDIGFLGETKTRSMIEVFERAMQKNSLEVNRDYISSTDLRFEDGGYDAMEKLFAKNAVPRALICGYDYLAIGAMKCIYDHGLSVPEDIALVGKDEVYESSFLIPSLSSVDTRINEACVIATDEIMKVLNGNIANSRISLCARFNKRESSEIQRTKNGNMVL